MTAAIEVRAVGKSFNGGLPVLAGIELDIGAGEVVSVVGRSGCGKRAHVPGCNTRCVITPCPQSNSASQRPQATPDTRG